jgi:BirA family biotin operon repressor/biotin-[acetyl-CoA-carboxylase] ligase
VYGESRRGYYRQNSGAEGPVAHVPLEVFDVLDSTMDAEPPTLPYTAAALVQLRGRGRTGPWHSPRGGAWLTVFLKARPPAGLPVALGGCLAERLEKLAGIGLGVKWPNDIVYSGAKLAGILVEHRGGMLRVGIGVNVYNKPPPGAISLSELGYRGPLARVYLEAVEAAMQAVYNPGYCIARARERDVLRGCRVEVDTGDSVVRGIAEGIAWDGGLRVGGRLIYCCHILSYNCGTNRVAPPAQVERERSPLEG